MPRRQKSAKDSVSAEGNAEMKSTRRNTSGLRRGNPGNSGGKKGRSGRKPDAWKALCRRLVNRESTIRAMKRILRDPKHPAFKGLLKDLTEQGYGKVAQGVEVSGKLTLEQILSASRAPDKE